MITDGKKVCEVFRVNEGELFRRTHNATDPHWSKMYEFYVEMKHREADGLTDAQIKWLERIESSLEEK